MKKADILKVFSDIKNIIFHPSKFFKSVKNEKDVNRSLKVYAVQVLIVSILGAFLTSFALGSLSFVLLPIIFVGIFLLGYGFTLLWAGIINIFLRLFGVKKTDHKKTVSVYLYSSILDIFAFIPIIGHITGFYKIFYLLPKVISIKYNISHCRALIATLLPSIILIILIFSVVIFYFPSLTESLNTEMHGPMDFDY